MDLHERLDRVLAGLRQLLDTPPTHDVAQLQSQLRSAISQLPPVSRPGGREATRQAPGSPACHLPSEPPPALKRGGRRDEDDPRFVDLFSSSQIGPVDRDYYQTDLGVEPVRFITGLLLSDDGRVACVEMFHTDDLFVPGAPLTWEP